MYLVERQDREYAEEQENSRRKFEQELEATRTEREKDRQQFEASLAADNRAAAKEAALIQATATREVAAQQSRIARAAARAAITAAIAAFLSVVVTAFPIIKAAWFSQTTAAQAPIFGSRTNDATMKPYRGPPATLGSTAVAQVCLIVWCKACQHRVEHDPAEIADDTAPDLATAEPGTSPADC
jgi:hypothetical protein